MDQPDNLDGRQPRHHAGDEQRVRGLIYLDPPFNSKADYAAPIGSKAAGAAFKDTWTLTDVDVEWINLIEAKHSALYRVLLAAITDSDKSYLAYMAARLLEMRRLLRPEGSIYLHCDPTMSHYLKLVMDAVFGKKNYQNEISWRRTTTKNDYRQGATNWPRVRDVLLHYAASRTRSFRQPFAPYSEEYIKKFYRNVERIRDGGTPSTIWRLLAGEREATRNTPFSV